MDRLPGAFPLRERVDQPSTPAVQGATCSARAVARPARGKSPLRRKSPLPMDVVAGGMVVRRFVVDPCDVVFVKGIVEASDGLAAIFAESGGDLSIVAPRGREKELADLLSDLAFELGKEYVAPPPEGFERGGSSGMV